MKEDMFVQAFNAKACAVASLVQYFAELTPPLAETTDTSIKCS